MPKISQDFPKNFFVLVVFDENLEIECRVKYDRFYALERLASHVTTCERYGFIYTVYDWDVAIDSAPAFKIT